MLLGGNLMNYDNNNNKMILARTSVSSISTWIKTFIDDKYEEYKNSFFLAVDFIIESQEPPYAYALGQQYNLPDGTRRQQGSN